VVLSFPTIPRGHLASTEQAFPGEWLQQLLLLLFRRGHAKFSAKHCGFQLESAGQVFECEGPSKTLRFRVALRAVFANVLASWVYKTTSISLPQARKGVNTRALSKPSL